MTEVKSSRGHGRIAHAFGRHKSDNPWLDALRSLAILLVLLRHGQRVANAGPDLSALETIAINGWLGVDLFFVLSGYLVTGGYLSRCDARGRADLGQYAWKRILRIVPAYLVVMACVVAGFFPGFPVSDEALAYRVLYHLAFMQDVLPSDINVVFWSLGVEVKFYAMVPLLVMLLFRLRTTKQATTLLLGLIIFGTVLRSSLFGELDQASYQDFWSTLRSPFYACVEPFMFGVLIAFLERHGLLERVKKAAAPLFFGSFSVLVFWMASTDFMARITFWDASLQPLLIAALFALLVLAAVQMKPIRLPGEPVFRCLSRLSYALYLVHFPLIPLCLQITIDLGAGLGLFWTLYIVLSTICAFFLYLLVEHPFLSPARQASARTVSA